MEQRPAPRLHVRTAGAATSNTLLPCSPSVGPMPIQRLGLPHATPTRRQGSGTLNPERPLARLEWQKLDYPTGVLCRETKHSPSCRTRSSANENRVSLSKSQHDLFYQKMQQKSTKKSETRKTEYTFTHCVPAIAPAPGKRELAHAEASDTLLPAPLAQDDLRGFRCRHHRPGMLLARHGCSLI